MEKQYYTPILLLIFNRPDITKLMMESLKKIKPKYLFVAADGPRKEKEGESQLCEDTRKAVTDNVNWECEMKTFFRDENKGLKIAVKEAIDWFFDNVEQGIILEDDIVGSPAFFDFCEINLERYKNDERIMLISGFNHLEKWNTTDDYFFSRIGAIWGWATWKRAWKLNYNNPLDWNKAKNINLFENIFPYYSQYALDSLHRVFENTFNGSYNSWAYIWTFYRIINSGLSIIPNENLVKNIGFGGAATHIRRSDQILQSLKKYNPDYSDIKHPLFIVPNIEFDLKVDETYNRPKKKKKRLIKRIKNRVKILIGRA